MGIFDKVANLASGADSPENAEYQAQARQLFNEKVEEGDSYTLVGVFSEHQKVNVGRTLLRGGRVSTSSTYDNYVLGYRSTPSKEIVVVGVNPELTEAGSVTKCTPDKDKAKKGMMGYELSGEDFPEKLHFVVSNTKMSDAYGYLTMKATYLREQDDFDAFFKAFNQ